MSELKSNFLKIIAPFLMVALFLVFLRYDLFGEHVTGKSPMYDVVITEINLEENYLRGITRNDEDVIVIPLEGYPIKLKLDHFIVGDQVEFDCSTDTYETNIDIVDSILCFYYSAELISSGV